MCTRHAAQMSAPDSAPSTICIKRMPLCHCHARMPLTSTGKVENAATRRFQTAAAASERRFVHCATKSKATPAINRAIGKCIRTTCCACFASSAALRSKGCKVSSRSLRDDFAGHLRVNRAEVRKSSCLAEGEGKLLVRIEHFGFEDSVRADDRVWNIVAIGPRYGCTDRDRQGPRAEAEVIDLYLRGFRLLLRACQDVLLADGDCSYADYQRRSQNCN